jgi:hypothetical protein
LRRCAEGVTKSLSATAVSRLNFGFVVQPLTLRCASALIKSVDFCEN